MFLSKLILNPKSRQVQSEIANAYQLHRTIMRAFPERLEPDERILFRLDVGQCNSGPFVLVQSVYEPDWSFLKENTNYISFPVSGGIAVKEFQIGLKKGFLLQFRLLANPTYKKKLEGEKSGKRQGILKEEQQAEWLKRTLNAAGCELLEYSIQELGIRTSWSKSEMAPVKHFAILYEGRVRVDDPVSLKKGIISGIGPAKGFGFGMLSILKIQGD